MSSFPLERVVVAFREIFLQPVFTGALFLASIKRPQQIEKSLGYITQKSTALSTFQTGLKILIGLGTIYRANNYLSNRALNNYVRDTWNWKKEIVLITGGSSGIGELMVQKFAKLSIKVVVVDVKPPNKPFPVGVAFYEVDLTDANAIQESAQRSNKRSDIRRC